MHFFSKNWSETQRILPLRYHVIYHGEVSGAAHSNWFSSQGTLRRISTKGPVQFNQCARWGPGGKMSSKFQLGVQEHISPHQPYWLWWTLETCCVAYFLYDSSVLTYTSIIAVLVPHFDCSITLKMLKMLLLYLKSCVGRVESGEGKCSVL